MTFALEALQDRGGVEAFAHELDGHATMHGLALLRDPDFAHASFSDLRKEAVRTNDRICAAVEGVDHATSSAAEVRPVGRSNHVANPGHMARVSCFEP
ncbi:MAG TPA: hypothetical protein PKE00_13385, partial [Planctomycetota bacterium]|nr:hypothetical protein [Planctomycetota bacterium]